MELRTLKDIEQSNAGLMGMNCSKVLRQEAIKRIKELTHEILYDEDELQNKHPDCKHWYECDDYYYSHCRCHIIITWIKHFFNITEEDLNA